MTNVCQKEQDITSWLQRVILAARQLDSYLKHGHISDIFAQRVVSLPFVPTCLSTCGGLRFDYAPHRSPQ